MESKYPRRYFECVSLQAPPMASCALLFRRSVVRGLRIPLHRSRLSFFDAHGACCACVGRRPYCLLFLTFPLRRFCGIYFLQLAVVSHLLCKAFSSLLVRFQRDDGLRFIRLAPAPVSPVLRRMHDTGFVLVLSSPTVRRRRFHEAGSLAVFTCSADSRNT